MRMVRMKKNDSFRLSCEAKDDEYVAVDITGWGIAAQIRAQRTGALLADLNVDVLSWAGGVFALICDDPSVLPIGQLLCDIKYSVSAVVFRTETFMIEIIGSVTE